MNDASYSFVSDKCLIRTCLVDDDIHSVRVSEVIKMKEALFLSEQVKRVESISLSTISVVDLLRPISVKNGPLACSFSEICLKPFAQTVNVARINLCSYLNVVFTEDDILIVS